MEEQIDINSRPSVISRCKIFSGGDSVILNKKLDEFFNEYPSYNVKDAKLFATDSGYLICCVIYEIPISEKR